LLVLQHPLAARSVKLDLSARLPKLWLALLANSQLQAQLPVRPAWLVSIHLQVQAPALHALVAKTHLLVQAPATLVPVANIPLTLPPAAPAPLANIPLPVQALAASALVVKILPLERAPVLRAVRPACIRRARRARREARRFRQLDHIHGPALLEFSPSPLLRLAREVKEAAAAAAAAVWAGTML